MYQFKKGHLTVIWQQLMTRKEMNTIKLFEMHFIFIIKSSSNIPFRDLQVFLLNFRHQIVTELNI